MAGLPITSNDGHFFSYIHNIKNLQTFRAMKIQHGFLICILLFNVVTDKPAWAEVDSQTSLRVVCYNIRHGRGMDNVVDLTRTANAIKALNPDLVAIQEVDLNTQRTNADQPKILGEKLGMHYAFGKAIGYQGGEYGLLVLSRFPILEHQMIILPQEGNQEQRGLQIAKIGIPDAKGKIIRFANTHLGGSQSAIETQSDRVNALLSDGDEPVILAGDFNARPESTAIQTLLKHWTDATDKTPTAPSNNPQKKIDYIFYKPPSRLKVKETKIVQDSITSDHLPVLVIFEILP